MLAFSRRTGSQILLIAGFEGWSLGYLTTRLNFALIGLPAWTALVVHLAVKSPLITVLVTLKLFTIPQAQWLALIW